MTEPPDRAHGGKGPLVLGVTWAEAGLALILLALRAKTASLCPPGQPGFGIFGLRWDFIWVVVALAFALCAQSFMTISVSYGLGDHQSLLSAHDIIHTNLWSWMAQIMAVLCLAISRIAVIAFLLSLQGRTSSIGRIVLYTVGTVQAMINVIEVVLILKQCDPIEKLWNPAVPGTCGRVLICSQVGYLQGSIGATADLFLAFYPVYIIGRLQQMKLSTKIGLCLLMSGGLVAGIAGINKTIAIASITLDDLAYEIYKLNTWVLTEMWFIIIFGSIPVLRLFFVRFTQDIKCAAGYGHSSSRTNPSDYLSTAATTVNRGYN
ncbi:hypothetical protein ANOM_001465 [Aspergillus nomiae NRRL 13137]|uniref:Rhodopsin domain-containing protein n=1 Tax=Aspergillus nomiae NRRL (strain ATCC 15546 / NRRL 13137 / CBS 260.88 / M93) TaxID=1509407 RepID=A0A0L1JF07_ASPN3|nr:uncharacterized protein ANOM_001465 [Aspergillus nomiae NRRL 13137]KNG90331.1 hypothetical protein ANOM_001465 [Aspergillus nomiae NRRL 13137]